MTTPGPEISESDISEHLWRELAYFKDVSFADHLPMFSDSMGGEKTMMFTKEILGIQRSGKSSVVFEIHDDTRSVVRSALADSATTTPWQSTPALAGRRSLFADSETGIDYRDALGD